MKQYNFAAVAAIMALLMTGGCAGNSAVVTKTPATAPLSTNQPPLASDEIKKPYKVINAIAAIVNDEIITLYEVDREAQPAINEAEKKGALTNEARSRILHTALDLLIEKKLTAQKIKELNIHVSDEEIQQAIDDVRKQNNIPTQEALITALAKQGLTMDQYRAQLREQLEKLKLVSMEV
ncbi:MAG: SurA N-terminal domain-containing protein, partial [Desulfuromonadaceae bacterium]|nr:SurA N-terminal domain-containing protein [Desulfuromonadaceae bacterium]